MSRQQFLAELTQYLTFVTPNERDKILAAFEEKFDDVGVEGEATLLMELGTPMSIAIALKRRKEAGELGDAEDDMNDSPPDNPPPDAPETLSEEPLPISEHREGEYTPEPSLRDEIPADEASDDLAPPPEAGFEELPLSETPYEDEPRVEIPGISSLGGAAHIEPEPLPPRKQLTVGGAIGAAFLSIILAGIFLIPMAAGGYLLAIAANLIVGALRTMSTLTDALWLFAFGFSAAAAGLLFLWFFLWAVITIIHNLFLGKAYPGSRFKDGMKKTWKNIWIIFASFLVLGIACGAVSFGMGARPDDLFSNSVASTVLDWITNNELISFISKLFSVTA